MFNQHNTELILPYLISMLKRWTARYFLSYSYDSRHTALQVCILAPFTVCCSHHSWLAPSERLVVVVGPSLSRPDRGPSDPLSSALCTRHTSYCLLSNSWSNVCVFGARSVASCACSGIGSLWLPRRLGTPVPSSASAASHTRFEYMPCMSHSGNSSASRQPCTRHISGSATSLSMCHCRT